MKWSLRYSLCSLFKNAEQEPNTRIGIIIGEICQIINAVWGLNWKEENPRSCFLKFNKMKIGHSTSTFLQSHTILIIKLTWAYQIIWKCKGKLSTQLG